MTTTTTTTTTIDALHMSLRTVERKSLNICQNETCFEQSAEGNEKRILFRINFLVSRSGFSGNSAKKIKRARNA
jgi:hypothetical protein